MAGTSQSWIASALNNPVVLSAIAVAIIVGYYIRAWYKLRMFKGPWLASFSEAWLFGATSSGDVHMKLYDVCKKYGCNSFSPILNSEAKLMLILNDFL